MQFGSAALWEAVVRFDLKRPETFSNYASKTITGTILREINKVSPTVTIPVYVAEKIPAYNNTVRALEESLGRNPTIEEISTKSKIPIATIEKIIEVLKIGL